MKNRRDPCSFRHEGPAPARRSRGFALLLVLMLLASLGIIVISGQILVRQRLFDAHRRNRAAVLRIAAEAAVAQVLSGACPLSGAATGAVVRVPLSGKSRAHVSWEPASPPAASGFFIRALVEEAQPTLTDGGIEIEYLARRMGANWIIRPHRRD